MKARASVKRPISPVRSAFASLRFASLAWAVLMVLGTSKTAEAQEVLTLQAARASALAARPALAIQRAQQKEASAKTEEAKSARLPQVSAGLDVSASPGGQLVKLDSDFVEGLDQDVLVSGSPALGDSGAFEPQFRYGAMLGVSWQVYDFGRTEAAIRAAEAQRAAKSAEGAAVKQDLLRAVDSAYLHWLAAHERARFQSLEVSTAKKKLETLENEIELGVSAPSSRLALKAEIARARLREAYAVQAEKRALIALGDAAGAPFHPGTKPDVRILELGQEKAEVVDRAAAAEAQLRAAELALESAKKAQLPTLALSGQVGVRGQVSNLFPVYQGRVGLEFPIFDGGGRDARKKAARARARAAKAQLALEKTKTQRAQRDQNLAFTEASRRVKLAEAYFEVTQMQVLDAEEQAKASGLGPEGIFVAQAEQARARAELLNARVDRAAAYLGLTQ